MNLRFAASETRGAGVRLSAESTIQPRRGVPTMAVRNAAERIALIYTGHQVPFLGEVLFSAFNATAGFGAQLILRPSSSFTRKGLEKLILGVARNGIQGFLLIPPCAELLAGRTVMSDLNAAAIATAGAFPDMHTVRIDNR